MIPRLLEKLVYQRLTSANKIILVLGARQVGKTTLLKSLQTNLADKKVLYLNCDIEEDKNALDTTSLTVLGKLTSGVDYLFVDEAQRLSNPGLTMKIIYDNLQKVRVLATGSSSFDLRNKMSDPLTGRYFDFRLYPLSFREILDFNKVAENERLRKTTADLLLDEVLLYGFYPEIYLSKKREEKIALLQRICESYLFKDILSFQRIRNPKAIADLTKALAYQIGSEVNENELSMRLKIDRKTVLSYLDILEKSFVVIRVYPYSKNPRREIGKNYKIYFVDLGIRNVLIGDFNTLNVRQDAGFIWENFLFIERIKAYANSNRRAEYYFWRSYSGAEVDFIEKELGEGKIKAYEFKQRQAALSRGAKVFYNYYRTGVKLINKDNYLSFI